MLATEDLLAGSSIDEDLLAGSSIGTEDLLAGSSTDKVAGTVYLHLVSAIANGRVQISNNRGRVDGWTSPDRVFGLCIAVEGVARRKIEGKLKE